jgi:hypothetical protein
MSLGLNILLGDVTTLVRVAQDQGANIQYVLEVIWTYAQLNAKPLQWHNILMLMKVDLIHKADHDNMVWDVLREQEEFQAMSTI